MIRRALLISLASTLFLARAAAAAPFNPNDFASLGLWPGGTLTIDTTNLTYGGTAGGVIASQLGGADVAVFTFDGAATIADLDIITVIGSRAAVLLFQGDVLILGTIDASGGDAPTSSSAGGAGGAGGGSGGNGDPGLFAPGSPGQGTGGGGGASSSGIIGNGGGGGGFGGRGGAGQRLACCGEGAGGSTYGDLELALQGGSGGGGAPTSFNGSGFSTGGGGGGGGGAIEIGALGLLTALGASVLADGGNGGRAEPAHANGGGGSGGGIFLHAYSMTLDPTTVVSATGGTGRLGFGVDGGCGGGGRVLLMTNTSGALVNSATADVAPGAAFWGGDCRSMAQHFGTFDIATDPNVGAGAAPSIPVPEPGTLALLACGLARMAIRRRNR